MKISDRDLIRDAIEGTLFRISCEITERKRQQKPIKRIRNRYLRCYELFKAFGGTKVWWR